MLRRQAAILAAEQWKSAQNHGSHLVACTSTDRPDTSFVESFDLSNPVMSLDRLNRDPAGVTDTCPIPILREETPISDLLSYCASGLSCDLDIGQHDAITGCNENICLDSGNIGESITPHSLKTPPIADTPNNSLGSLLGPSLPAELADYQRRNHTVHQLENCSASLGQGNPALDVGLESHSAITDGVCLHEARRALSALELYLAGFPGQTALDELCLNHLRGRLGQ